MPRAAEASCSKRRMLANVAHPQVKVWGRRLVCSIAPGKPRPSPVSSPRSHITPGLPVHASSQSLEAPCANDRQAD